MSASGSKENDHHNYSLSVFFPCYNEEANIARVIEEALKFLPTLSNDFEIIIINDGSTDKTSAVVERFTETNSRIRIVNHHCNAGYGAALRSGFEAARKEFIFYTDGDGQFDISDLTELLPLASVAK